MRGSSELRTFFVYSAWKASAIYKVYITPTHISRPKSGAGFLFSTHTELTKWEIKISIPFWNIFTFYPNLWLFFCFQPLFSSFTTILSWKNLFYKTFFTNFAFGKQPKIKKIPTKQAKNNVFEAREHCFRLLDKI